MRLEPASSTELRPGLHINQMILAEQVLEQDMLVLVGGDPNEPSAPGTLSVAPLVGTCPGNLADAVHSDIVSEKTFTFDLHESTSTWGLDVDPRSGPERGIFAVSSNATDVSLYQISRSASDSAEIELAAMHSERSHFSNIPCISFAHDDSRLLLSGSIDTTICIYRQLNNRLRRIFQLSQVDPCLSMAGESRSWCWSVAWLHPRIPKQISRDDDVWHCLSDRGSHEAALVVNKDRLTARRIQHAHRQTARPVAASRSCKLPVYDDIHGWETEAERDTTEGVVFDHSSFRAALLGNSPAPLAYVFDSDTELGLGHVKSPSGAAEEAMNSADGAQDEERYFVVGRHDSVHLYAMLHHGNNNVEVNPLQVSTLPSASARAGNYGNGEWDRVFVVRQLPEISAVLFARRNGVVTIMRFVFSSKAQTRRPVMLVESTIHRECDSVLVGIAVAPCSASSVELFLVWADGNAECHEISRLDQGPSTSHVPYLA